MNYLKYDLEKEFEEILGKDPVRPCPKCGVNDAVKCTYGYRDYWGEYDCLAPDQEEIECDDCHHLYCDDCKEVKPYERRT